jgi:hypothetical protein
MSFYNMTEHTARKPHRCENCRQTIDPGERYCAERGIVEGAFLSWPSHIECRLDRLTYMVDSDIDEAGPLLDEIEGSGEGPDAFNLHPVTRARLEAALASSDSTRAADQLADVGEG